MITQKQLSEQLQTALNTAVGLNSYNFKIFAGTGKFKPYSRQGNAITEHINGVLSVVSSETSNTKTGIEFSMLNTILQIIIPLKNAEKDGAQITIVGDENGNETETVSETYKGNETKIDEIRQIVNDVMAQNTYATMTDKDSKSYVVSSVYSPLNDGERAQVQGIGLSYVFRTNIYYTIVQQGINSRAFDFMLDGIALPYEAISLLRSPILDNYVPSDSADGTAESIGTQQAFSINVELPALNDNITRALFDFLLDGKINTAHILHCDLAGIKQKDFLVQISEVSATAQQTMNVGQKISFIPIIKEYDFVEIANNLYIYYFGNVDSTAPISNVVMTAFDFHTKTFYNKPSANYPGSFTPSIGEADCFVITTKAAFSDIYKVR